MNIFEGRHLRRKEVYNWKWILYLSFSSFLLASDPIDLTDGDLRFWYGTLPKQEQASLLDQLEGLPWQVQDEALMTRTNLFNRFSEYWIRVPFPKYEGPIQALFLDHFTTGWELWARDQDGIRFGIYDPDYSGTLTRSHLITLSRAENKPNPDVLYLRLACSWGDFDDMRSFLAGSMESLGPWIYKQQQTDLRQDLWSVFWGVTLCASALLSLFLLFYSSQRNQSPFILFSIISFFAGLDHLINSTIWIAFNLPLSWYAQLPYFVPQIIPVAIILFIRIMFPGRLNRWLGLLVILHGLCFLSIMLFFNMFLWLLVGTMVFFFLVVVDSVSCLAAVLLSKSEDTTWLVILAFIFFTISAVLEALSFIGILPLDFDVYGMGLVGIAFAYAQVLFRHIGRVQKDNLAYSAELHQKQNELLELKQANLEAQFDALKEQIKPHFLFNTFSTLQSLIEENAEVAVSYVQELAAVYRYVLQTRDVSLIPIEQELHYLEAYFFLVSKRFGKNISLSITVPDELKSYLVPPLSMQLLIENAVKHNVISTKRPLKIEVFHESGFLVIRNNLQTKTTLPESTRVGLKNLISRYEFVTRQHVEVIKDRCFFSVKLPLISPEKLESFEKRAWSISQVKEEF